MQRKPSDRYAKWAWWRAAMAGEQPPITTEPQCGFFRARERRGRLYVAAMIDIVSPLDEAGNLVGDERLICVVGGEEYDAADMWLWLAKAPIGAEEHARLLAMPKVTDLSREVIV